MKIVPHPTIFLNKAGESEREQAIAELIAIASSNPGGCFNVCAFWFRQTRVPAVRAALEEYFEAVIAGDR